MRCFEHFRDECSHLVQPLPVVTLVRIRETGRFCNLPSFDRVRIVEKLRDSGEVACSRYRQGNHVKPFRPLLVGAPETPQIVKNWSGRRPKVNSKNTVSPIAVEGDNSWHILPLLASDYVALTIPERVARNVSQDVQLIAERFCPQELTTNRSALHSREIEIDFS
jgi:hypothetical protein